MELIRNNPYRIIGILAGATAKEQNRRVKRLQKFIEAEQEPPGDDHSFPVLGQIHRTVESISETASKLELNNDRMNAALFWFYNGNDITDADEQVEYAEIKFFKNIRHRLKISDKEILEAQPGLEMFLEKDIVPGSLLDKYMEEAELPQFEMIGLNITSADDSDKEPYRNE